MKKTEERLEQTIEEALKSAKSFDSVKSPLVYNGSIFIFNTLLKFLQWGGYKLRVERLDEVKEQMRGRYLLAFKHQHNFDIPLLASIIPAELQEHAGILVKKEFYTDYGRLVRWWFRRMSTVPIDRPKEGEKGSLDTVLNKAAAAYVKKELAAGKAFVFAPEATRKPGEMGRCYPLIFKVALELLGQRIDTPIITAGIEYENPYRPYLHNGWAVVRFNRLFPSQYREPTMIRNVVRLTNETRDLLARDSGLTARDYR